MSFQIIIPFMTDPPREPTLDERYPPAQLQWGHTIEIEDGTHVDANALQAAINQRYNGGNPGRPLLNSHDLVTIRNSWGDGEPVARIPRELLKYTDQATNAGGIDRAMLAASFGLLRDNPPRI